MIGENSCCAIIVTFNGERWINACLQTLLAGSAVPKIYVVDNGSTDSTVSIVKSFDGIHLIQSQVNMGFGGANNLALRKAYKEGYEYFFLVNQDTRVQKSTVEELIGQVKKTDHSAIVSPIQLNGRGDALDKLFESTLSKSHSKFPDHKLFMEDFSLDQLKESYQVKIVNAAFWMLSRKILEQVGVFHPFFFHYGEDTNYWDRAKHVGIKMVVAGRTMAYHDKIYRSRRHQSATNFFEKEVLKIKLDPDNSKGGIHVIFAFFSGLEIVLLNRQFGRIFSYTSSCHKIYAEVKRKIKTEKVDLSISSISEEESII